MIIKKLHNAIEIEDFGSFDLGLSVDCGQAFRWTQNETGHWCAVVGNRYLEAEQSEGKLIFYTDENEFEGFWRNYFDLDTDYAAICEKLSADTHLKAATAACPGIHILKQEPWEALCSFIISQNNNIPRIKGIIDRLCENFGEKAEYGYSFPSAERLAVLEPEDLAPLRAGFRAKYIIDAAKKVTSGEINFDKILQNDISFGRESLMKICGVGPKVAECCLLYGMKKSDAFPVDVWVKRIMSELYENGLPECAYPEIGIAQQYLFHWRRNPDNKLTK